MAVVLVGVYAAGVFGMLLHLLVQQWASGGSRARRRSCRTRQWTRLLVECAAQHGRPSAGPPAAEPRATVPVAFGTRRPSIVIPALADTWADDRRRAVLLHELAHVARYDCLTQLAGLGACALYWFHPAAWWVARRLRIERELACDDRVIAAGTEARDYAGHLLEIAYSLGRRGAPALAVSMARPRQLEGRMLAALDDRAQPARAGAPRSVVRAPLSRPSCCSRWPRRRRRLLPRPRPERSRRRARRAAGTAPNAAPSEAIESPLNESVRRLVRAVGG